MSAGALAPRKVGDRECGGAEPRHRIALVELSDYQRLSRRTAAYPRTDWLAYPALGLAGEAGEEILPPTTLIGIVLLWMSAIFTIYTGWDYFRAGIHHLIKEDEA